MGIWEKARRRRAQDGSALGITGPTGENPPTGLAVTGVIGELSVEVVVGVAGLVPPMLLKTIHQTK